MVPVRGVEQMNQRRTVLNKITIITEAHIGVGGVNHTALNKGIN
jgi:hypothetical protein